MFWMASSSLGEWFDSVFSLSLREIIEWTPAHIAFFSYMRLFYVSTISYVTERHRKMLLQDLWILLSKRSKAGGDCKHILQLTSSRHYSVNLQLSFSTEIPALYIFREVIIFFLCVSRFSWCLFWACISFLLRTRYNI